MGSIRKSWRRKPSLYSLEVASKKKRGRPCRKSFICLNKEKLLWDPCEYKLIRTSSMNVLWKFVVRRGRHTLLLKESSIGLWKEEISQRRWHQLLGKKKKKQRKGTSFWWVTGSYGRDKKGTFLIVEKSTIVIKQMNTKFHSPFWRVTGT